MSDRFVLSNVGQVRHAGRVVDQLGLPAPVATILMTRANPGLAVAMADLANHLGLAVQHVRLPTAPTDPLPWRIRRVAQTLDRLVADFPAERLWLANANSFYGYLAAQYAASGTEINLFEEGLGTYRSHTDLPYRRPPLTQRLTSTRIEMIEALTSTRRSRRRRIRRAGHRAVRFMAETGPGRVGASLLTRGVAAHFHQPWTEFDSAVVTFPSALDPELVRAESLITLDPDRAECLPVELAPLDAPLLLSQRYGVAPEPWGRAIAAELMASGVEAVFCKFHPRETPRERASLRDALGAAGLALRDTTELDPWPAEMLITSGIVSDVIGLTSSTLLYRPCASETVTYRSIVDGVLARLRCDPGVSERTLTQLASDAEIFHRVTEAVST